MILRLKPSGLAHAGPPCSSFVYINSYTHGCTKSRPLGLAALREYVRDANRSLGNTTIGRSIQCGCTCELWLMGEI